MAAIVVDDEVLIGFGREDDRLVLALNIRDEANEPVLQVRSNELVMSTGAWDIEFVGRKLTLREDARQLLLVLQFEPPTRILFERARLFRNGVEITVDERLDLLVQGRGAFAYTNMRFTSNVGITIGESPHFPGAFRITPLLGRDGEGK